MGATKPLIIAYPTHPAGTRLPINGTMPVRDLLICRAILACRHCPLMGSRAPTGNSRENEITTHVSVYT